MGEWIVVMRYTVAAADDVESFQTTANAAARVLGACDGCLGVDVARASDDPSRWIVTARWSSVGSYRRALSSYDVKVHAVPFLSGAVDEPTAFEVLFGVHGDIEHASSGDLAGDAGTIDRSR